MLGSLPASVSTLLHWPREMLSDCPWNCSGRGTCQDGQCVCLVQYSGGSCGDANVGYFIAFGSIFFCLAIVSFLQLLLCMHSDYSREERKSWVNACRPSIQKLLYVMVIFAGAIRAAYFFTKWQVSDNVSHALWTAYYPFILTSSCLIICYWAEAFHLSNVRCDSPRLLSKSLIAFVVFNIVIYMLLVTELVFTELVADENMKELAVQVCDYIMASLMLVVVVFFIIYGVEVFFKVHGAFVFAEVKPDVDPWQLHMSRLGLVAQALLQLTTALCLLADLAAGGWRSSMTILSQNFYDIMWRVVEFGVALWFPCVLWNCWQPEKLWVLNPRRLLLDFHKWEADRGEKSCLLPDDGVPGYGSASVSTNVEGAGVCSAECWICYDGERSDAGPLIRPCLCKGDVAFVHHDCLRQWLIESAGNGLSAKCKVCDQKYKLEASYTWSPCCLKPRHWVHTFVLVICLVGLPFGAYGLTHSLTNSYLKMVVIGAALLAEFLVIKFFCTNVRAFYKRVRVASMKIVERSRGGPKQGSASLTPANNSTSTVTSASSLPADPTSTSPPEESSGETTEEDPSTGSRDSTPSTETASPRSRAFSVVAQVHVA